MFGSQSTLFEQTKPHCVVAEMTLSYLNWFASGCGRRFGCMIAIVACLVGSFAPTANAQNNTQRGATLGGITGAIAGANIGENNNEAGAGAAIGGALGIVAGGMLGNAKDKDLAYQNNQYYRAQQYQMQQQMPAPVYTQPIATGAVSYSDVIAMSRSGVGEGVILNQIATRGVQRQPVVSDIISLHQQGVSENVIAAMQQTPLRSQIGGGSYVAAPTTTIVETPVYVAPRVYPVPVYQSPRHYGPVYRARPNYHIHYSH